MKRIEIIRNKLNELITKDIDFKTFGSKEPWAGHEYELFPCMSIEEIEEFEKDAEIKLPLEYREYITTVADGGAGPCYGLYDLAEGVKRQSTYFKEEDQYYDIFFTPFPYNNQDVLSKIDNNETVLDDSVSIFERKHPVTGIIFLSEYGCGGYYVLVINGEQHGKVWFFHSDGYLNPCHIKGKQLGFYDWFEHWLDKSLNDLEKI